MKARKGEQGISKAESLPWRLVNRWCSVNKDDVIFSQRHMPETLLGTMEMLELLSFL